MSQPAQTRIRFSAGVVVAAAATLCASGLAATSLSAAAMPIAVSRQSGEDGPLGHGHSGQPAISFDGRVVAFESSATNLVPEDRGRIADVYVRDLASDETILVSRATGSDGAKGNAPSGDPRFRTFRGPAISADGRVVAFTSLATNLDPDVSDGRHIYVRDLVTDTTIAVDRASGLPGAIANGDSGEPSLSADGRLIAFTSTATNLDPADPDPAEDIYVRDLSTGETRLVSRASGANGERGADFSRDPVIAADGSAVAFFSFAQNLVPPVSGTFDFGRIFVRDLQTHETVLASRASGPDGRAAGGGDPSISADGGRVAFGSGPTLHPAAKDEGGGVFVREIATERTIFASPGPRRWGKQEFEFPATPSISADGNLVAFDAHYVGGNRDSRGRVEVRNIRRSRTRPVEGAVAASPSITGLLPTLSGDGQWVAFQSRSPKLASSDRNRFLDVFVVRR